MRTALNNKKNTYSLSSHICYLHNLKAKQKINNTSAVVEASVFSKQTADYEILYKLFKWSIL